MHFFVWLLIILLIVLIVGIILGALYLSSGSSNQKLLDEITFAFVGASLENGIPADNLWSTTNEAVLAKVGALRTFLMLSEWEHPTAITDPSLPYYFTLPEPAFSVKVYVVLKLGITYPSPNTDVRGVLLTPTRVALEFTENGIPSGIFFTGQQVTTSPQELGIIIIYSTAP